MPRDSQIQPNRQVPTKQQDTFRYSTPDMKVVARPVDATTPPLAHYQQPDVPNLMRGLSTSGIENADRNARLLMNAIGGLGEALHTYAGIKKEQNKEDMNNGYYNALKGLGLTPEANFYEQMGHSLYKGEAASVDYERAVTEAYADFGHTAKPEEWNQKLNEIRSSFMAGKDNFFMEGFHDRSRSIDRKFTTQYYTDQLKQRKEETINAIAVTASQDIGKIIENNGSNKEAIAKGIRNYLTVTQESGVNLNKQELSELFVKVVGERAEAQAAPWLMDFTKVPDNAGVKLSDTLLMEGINNYTSKALNKQAALESKAIASAHKAEVAQEKADRAWFTRQLISGKDVNSLLATPEGQAVVARMGPSAYFSLKAAGSREQYAENSNIDTVRKFTDAAKNLQLDGEELEKALKVDKSISQADVNKILGIEEATRNAIDKDSVKNLTEYGYENRIKQNVSTAITDSLDDLSSFVTSSEKTEITNKVRNYVEEKIHNKQAEIFAAEGRIDSKYLLNHKGYQDYLKQVEAEGLAQVEKATAKYHPTKNPSLQVPPEVSKAPTGTGKYKALGVDKEPINQIINTEGLRGKEYPEISTKLRMLRKSGDISDDQIDKIFEELENK